VFEWDEKKNRANQAKHGIPFDILPECFKGPMLVKLDNRLDYGETRWVAIALLSVVPVVIVYTERGQNIRLISARKADRRERERFKAYLFKGRG
jgi:uncharacterized protein